MTSLISYGVATEESEPQAISNNGFWPDVDPADFRTVMRVDSSMTGPRVQNALIAAIANVNRVLSTWQQGKIDAGISAIEGVAKPFWAAEDHFENAYTRAVYATAKAELMDGYRDVSATGNGDDRGESKTEAADDYRRLASWAISQITDRSNVTVELI
jgi:hypothetical protein